MAEKQKVMVVIASNAAMEENLPAAKLAEQIAGRGWAVSTVPLDRPLLAMDTLMQACREQRPDGAVVAGPTSFLEKLPSLIEVEGHAGLRPVPVNVAERCAFLHKDPAEALVSALRQIEVGAARSIARRSIELVERPVQKQVLVVGTGPSAAQVARRLLENGLQVLVLAQAEAPQVSMPGGAEVITSARLRGLSGFPGDFRAVIERPAGQAARRVGAVIIAQEARRGVPPLPEAVLSDERVVRVDQPSEDILNGKKGKIRSLVFLLDLGGPESRKVAAEVQRLALAAVEKGIAVTVFYRHMAVHGRTGQAEYDRLRHAGVRMIRYDQAPAIAVQEDGIHLSGHDMILGETRVEVTADRLVVTDPLLPAPISADLSALLNQPVDCEGFLQPANVRHLPVGSPRRGVYFAGSGHQDLSEDEARQEASAVAGQVAALLSASSVFSPKALVLHDREACAMCLTCLRSCYHGAITLSEDGGTVRFEPGACWECGLCASVCPQRAITRLFSPEAELRAAVRSAGRLMGGKQPTVAFLCQNSPVLALERAGRLGLQLPPDVVAVEVPCAGYVSQGEVLAALNAGAERVVVAACHEDNCRSLKGSTSARGRSRQVKRDLDALGLAPGRVEFYGVAANEPYRLIQILSGASEASNGKQEAANG
jgi:coenzyme F420-reducing hydrogenase delta subunit/ferredoxin